MEPQESTSSPANAPDFVSPQSVSPAPSTTGKLKISLRGKVVKLIDSIPAAAPSSKVQSAGQAPESLLPAPSPLSVRSPPLTASSQPQDAHTQFTEAPPKSEEEQQRLEDLKWCARSLLRKLLTQRACEYAVVPGSDSKQEPVAVTYRGGDVPASLKPDCPEEALLMLAALRALGKTDAARVLLPHPSPPSSTHVFDVSLSSTMVTDSTQHQNLNDTVSSLAVPRSIEVALSKEEVMIAKNAAKFAAGAAPGLMRKVEEDDESLALELELEFAQLDPETRVGLLQQIDTAEHKQFIEGSARTDRLARAAREAAFHNAQVNVDRGRIGPYYFDPHTRTHQVIHTIAIPEPECQPLLQAPSEPSLLIVNPSLPLPNGFEYVVKQTSDDFHPSLFAKLSQDQRKVLKLSLKSKSLPTATASSSTSNTSEGAKKDEILNATVRYAVMEGYVQWLRREVETHWAASAPLVPYESYLSQFKHQWDALQPQGCFDYLIPDALQESQQNASTTLWGSSFANGSSNDGSSKAGIVPVTVSLAIRKVWKEHRKSLEAEHAVELAMAAAERGLRRCVYGDEEDMSIDIGKQTTRDERRKLQRHEKERDKLKALFLAQDLVDPKAFPLEQLSWSDWQTLFASLGLSAETMLEEEAIKNQPPPLLYGPNGQVRARSHKKGAAKAARLAAKKAAMDTEASHVDISTHDDSKTPPTSLVTASTPASIIDLTVPASPRKKRPRTSNNEEDTYERDHFVSSTSHRHADQLLQSSTPYEILYNMDPNVQRCTVCGASDNDDDFVRCATCQRTYHTFCLEDTDNLSFDGSWVCHNCVGVAP